MNLIEKIQASFADQNFRFGTAEELNAIANGNIDMPAILMYRPEDWSTFDDNGREQSTFLIFFCDNTSYSYSTAENNEIVEQCKKRALNWAKTIDLHRLKFAEKLKLKPVYLEFSNFVTGVMLEARLRETYPDELTCENFTPDGDD